MATAQLDDLADALRAFCERLRWAVASGRWTNSGGTGPPGGSLGRRRSAILTGKIWRLPDRDVVCTVVLACAEHARKQERRVSEPTAEQWWHVNLCRAIVPSITTLRLWGG